MNEAEKQKANRALDRAKIGLMTGGSVFLMTIAFNLRYHWNEDIPTAQVDGINMEISPAFFLQLSDKERVFLIAHEVWHVAFDHILRRQERDPLIYNFAGDYVINQHLVDAGFTMPTGGLLDAKYRGKTTNEVYDMIYKEVDKFKQQMKSASGTFGAFGNDIKEPGDDNGKDDKDGKGQDGPSRAEVEANVKGILVKAQTQSIMAGESQGKIPSEIARGLDDLLNPVLPWNILLHNYLQDRTKDDYSWARPNKRFAPDYYLPTQYSEALQHITIAIDTSGSIGQEELNEILSEIIHIKQAFNPKRLTILDCDSKVHNVYDVDEFTDVQDLKFSGGGGTSFIPVFKYCAKHETNALLYFTDLYGSFPDKDPGFPVLWLCYSRSKPAPFGDTIYYHPQ